MNQATERNIRVQNRYDELMGIGKHGHYETMFQVVREEVESLHQQLTRIVTAIDNQMVTTHIGVFNVGDDPEAALNKLMCWSQDVGAFFAQEQLAAAIAECKLKDEALIAARQSARSRNHQNEGRS